MQLPGRDDFDEADVSDKPQWVRDLPRLGKKRRAEVREDYRDMLRSLKGVDEATNAMLKLLAQRSELKNTYVVFTSDHGQHFGEHRWVKDRGANHGLRGGGVYTARYPGSGDRKERAAQRAGVEQRPARNPDGPRRRPGSTAGGRL